MGYHSRVHDAFFAAECQEDLNPVESMLCKCQELRGVIVPVAVSDMQQVEAIIHAVDLPLAHTGHIDAVLILTDLQVAVLWLYQILHNSVHAVIPAHAKRLVGNSRVSACRRHMISASLTAM
jgi:hypothetical protein